ncbi:MAG TPA: putative sulfate exporter family transporter [Methylomirabilota bacterium]|nr:putative sulfate exporter family transporter [Methylomirabilota bacterium]
MASAAKIIFILALILCLSGWISPPVALSLGIIFGLSMPHPYPHFSRSAARILLQVSVVALGFGMNLHEIVKAGRSGFIYTALGISFSLVVGLALGKFLRINGNASYLITAGTAICGGSAIAAIGPILHADDEEMAVSLGTVFILNSIALLAFPPIGNILRLTPSQFGLWAALAIHDTSSVVGAAARYGAQALVVGTTVKLARALWIVPLALATAAVKHSKTRLQRSWFVVVQLPWFILFFCVAAVVNTYVPAFGNFDRWAFGAGRLGLTATLFLIGTGISLATLKSVGWRPLLQGVLLWIMVAAATLYLIRMQIISF